MKEKVEDRTNIMELFVLWAPQIDRPVLLMCSIR
jgi:hypothetical protein